MSTIITSVDRHSPAEHAGIHVGEQLLTINGHPIVDVLDKAEPYRAQDALLEAVKAKAKRKQDNVTIVLLYCDGR